MKFIKWITTLVLSGIFFVSSLSIVDIGANEVTEIQSKTNGAHGIKLKDNEKLSDYGEIYIDEYGAELLADSQERTTASVKTWAAFTSAINNSTVSVVNVSSSFSSSWLYDLRKINRPVLINFINNSTISMYHNYPITIGFGGSVTFESNSNQSIITNGNQVTQPFVQGDAGSRIIFSGDVVIGNTTTQMRAHPFIRTNGTVQINPDSEIVLNEAIEANQVNVLSYGSLLIKAHTLTPVEIIASQGRLDVGNFSTFEAIHNGASPVIRLLGSGQFLIDNPYSIHLQQNGIGASTQPLVHSLGANIQIKAVRNAFWRNNNFSWSPTHSWNSYLETQLFGANGNQVSSSNISSFSQNFLGFSEYREYNAGSNSQIYPDTFPPTESNN